MGETRLSELELARGCVDVALVETKTCSKRWARGVWRRLCINEIFCE